ncbi:MAG TPA: homoserine O-acetyltransferase [Terriglobia bacterium]|nr:homoserine O-acetyltransferase [Terriglobia bacterium]
MDEPGSVGIVETKYLTFAEPPNEMTLECGRTLGPITLAYETYGELNEARDNAILVVHALSGDAHAAGYHHAREKQPGWWDIMIGPGRAFDTRKYFVICSNVIGGCQGSTGPSSINPSTGRPYGLSFPMVTIRDWVDTQKVLIDHLGIKRLLGVVGGSTGGMQVLQWIVSYPDMVRLAIPIATTNRLSAQAIAFNEVGRQAIQSDPNWREGDYYGKAVPRRGLAIARMIGHITYLSDRSMHQKFGRRLQDKSAYGYDFRTDFEVESYLRYKGNHFVSRFDANSYLYITKAMDYFDLTQAYGSLEKALAGVKARFLVISFSSDWLFPTYQSKEIVSALRRVHADAIFTEIKTDYGHDAFLLESRQLSSLITNFLSHGWRQES